MAASRLRGTPTPAILDPALDRHLTARYFAGDSLTEIRYAYYAIRWHFALPDSSLPLSKSTMDGFGRLQPAQMRDPVTYEDTVLRANWMLASDPSAEGADAAAATLLTFDLYSRAADILRVQPEDLVPPNARLGSRHWGVTFFPASRSKRSKTLTQDDTSFVGQVNPRRSWLRDIMPILAARPRGQPMLGNSLAVLEARFAAAGLSLGLPHAVPHLLRHGGPSADCAAEVITDVQVQRRGWWASVKSVQRYTKPGDYARALQALTPALLARTSSAETQLKTELIARLRPDAVTVARRRR